MKKRKTSQPVIVIRVIENKCSTCGRSDEVYGIALADSLDKEDICRRVISLLSMCKQHPKAVLTIECIDN